LASTNGHTAAVELLLAAGADKEAKGGVREIERLRENGTQRDRKFDEMVALPRGKLPLLAHEASALHVLCLGYFLLWPARWLFFIEGCQLKRACLVLFSCVAPFVS
jgi:hypothetical protein